GAVVGDAVDRERSQCAAQPLRAAVLAGTFRRSAPAHGGSDRSAARAAAARPLYFAPARGRGEDRAGAPRAGSIVPQPPRLCAADLVPRLRFPLRLSELSRLAGRSPLPPPASVPPLRFWYAASADLSEMRSGRVVRSGGPGRRAAGRGGAGAVPRGPHPGAL